MKLDTRKSTTLIAGALLALGAITVPTLGQAAKVVDIEISTAPPPPPVVVEVTPAPRVGYIYQPGHYRYDGSNFVWSEPQFIQERPGHTYTPYLLEKRGDKWRYRAGHWDDD